MMISTISDELPQQKLITSRREKVIVCHLMKDRYTEVERQEQAKELKERGAYQTSASGRDDAIRFD